MMHRSIAAIILIMVSIFAKAQNFQTITRVVYEQQRISGYNSLNKLAVQVDCKDMVWQVLPDNSIKIWDDIHSFTVIYTTLSVPAFAALGDSLRAWQVSCGQSSTPFPTNLDTTHIDTSLIVPTMIENFSNRNNDTLSAILAAIVAHKDTSNYYILDSINYRLSLLDKSDTDTSLVLPDILANFATKNNDTLSAILLALNNLTPNDTSNYWILDSIYQSLITVDTFCLTGALNVEDSLLHTTVVDCNGDNAINVKVCNAVGDTSNQAALYEIRDTITSKSDTMITLLSQLSQFSFEQCGNTAGNALITSICGNVSVDSNSTRKYVSIDNLPTQVSYNINETFDLNNSTITLPSGTYHSYTIIGITGTYNLTEQTVITGIPAGVTLTKTATTTFTNDVVVTTTGRVIINTIR